MLSMSYQEPNIYQSKLMTSATGTGIHARQCRLVTHCPVTTVWYLVGIMSFESLISIYIISLMYMLISINGNYLSTNVMCTVLPLACQVEALGPSTARWHPDLSNTGPS